MTTFGPLKRFSAVAVTLIRLEIAKGKNDNEALYLRFGHAF